MLCFNTQSAETYIATIKSGVGVGPSRRGTAIADRRESKLDIMSVSNSLKGH